MKSNLPKNKLEYVVLVGMIRIGLLLACLYLLKHLFSEPREEVTFHPTIEAALVLAVCSAIGLLAGLILWHVRGKHNK